MRYKKSFIIFLVATILLNLSIVLATNTNYTNSKDIFRIHVVANSDSIDDQLLKYTMAKQVNEYITKITASSTSKEESKKIVENNIQNILNICNDILLEENYDYTIKAYIGKIQYSAKYKDENFMEAGLYDSLKIVIGNGNGQNWWSLIYPTSFQETTQQDIYDKDTNYSFKFMEIFKTIFYTEK